MSEATAPTPIRPRLTVHFVIICLLTAVFAVVTLLIIRPLLVPLFLAIVFAILASPVQERLANHTGRRWLVGGLLTLALVALAVGFPAAVAWLAFEQSESTIISLGGGRADLKPGQEPNPDPARPEDHPASEPLVGWVARATGRPAEVVRGWLREGLTELREVFYTRAATFVGRLPEVFMGLGVFMVALFFFLADGSKMQSAWEAITPLPLAHDRLLRRNFARVCRGLVAATLLASLAQAATFALGLFVIELLWDPGIGWWIFPLTMACWVCSLVPFVGAWLVWLPTAVGLLIGGYPFAGLILAAYGGGVVSQIDNIIRMWVLHGTARMHPLLGFVTILGGIQVFGVFGLFLAPVVAAVTVTLLRILRSEMIRLAAGPRPNGEANGGANGETNGETNGERNGITNRAETGTEVSSS
jgi:predicted PurR-regulated permease PerM